MKSLDYVQQPDGTFRWEMVEMDEAARAPKPTPEKTIRKTPKKVSEPVFVEEPTESPDF